MSVFMPTKSNKAKVQQSEYILTEDKPAETDTKPDEPVAPAEPEAK